MFVPATQLLLKRNKENTMNSKTIIAASAVALMMATAAHAATYDSNAQNNSNSVLETPHDTGSAAPQAGDTSVTDDIKSGLNKADKNMRSAADDVKASIVGDDNKKEVSVDVSTTANGMINQTIESPNGKPVAKVEDIIVAPSGEAKKLVVSDGGVLGIGDKKAAFDYDRVITQKGDGKVVMQISQDLIDSAKDFSYDATKETSTTAAKGPGNYSIEEILNGRVLDPNGDNLAEIENVTFNNGQAQNVIVGYDKTLGLGGKVAAFDFNTVKLQQSGKDTVDIKLSPEQTDQFKRFKASTHG
jgi:sporulation protein YlmC with PRC-barrel domain